MTNIPDENGHVFHTVRETVCFMGAGGRTDEFLSRISHLRVSNELQAAILAFAYKLERDLAAARADRAALIAALVEAERAIELVPVNPANIGTYRARVLAQIRATLARVQS